MEIALKAAIPLRKAVEQDWKRQVSLVEVGARRVFKLEPESHSETFLEGPVVVEHTPLFNLHAASDAAEVEEVLRSGLIASLDK